MGLIEQMIIALQFGYAKAHITRLFGTEQFTGTADFQIFFGN